MITLETLPQATAQQVFDQVALHLVNQAQKSIGLTKVQTREIPSCMYFSSGLKCAAGCLIGDKEYSIDFENKDWKYLLALGSVPYSHAELIIGLQKIHDTWEVHTWISTLRNFASLHNLNSLVLNDK